MISNKSDKRWDNRVAIMQLRIYIVELGHVASGSGVTHGFSIAIGADVASTARRLFRSTLGAHCSPRVPIK